MNSMWKVSGVDSYNTQTEQWCRHDIHKQYNIIQHQQGLQYFQCPNCGRQFQVIHPVVAEALMRGKDDEIMWLKRQLSMA